MRASGTDRYLIPNILGISSDDWAHVVQHSGLFYPDKKIKSIAWQHLLGFTIDFRSFNIDGSSAMWFRFLSRIDLGNSRSQRSSRGHSIPLDEVTALPMTEEADSLLEEYYANISHLDLEPYYFYLQYKFCNNLKMNGYSVCCLTIRLIKIRPFM